VLIVIVRLTNNMSRAVYQRRTVTCLATLTASDCTVVLQQKCDNATLIIFISTTTTTTTTTTICVLYQIWFKYLMNVGCECDDQAGQQHEPADPGMAEPDHAALGTPWPQSWNRPVVVHAANEELRERRWCGHSGEAKTPDEPQRWGQTGAVAVDKLAARSGRNFHSRVSSGWVTPLTNENSRQWHIYADDKAGEERQNSITRFSVTWVAAPRSLSV